MGRRLLSMWLWFNGAGDKGCIMVKGGCVALLFAAGVEAGRVGWTDADGKAEGIVVSWWSVFFVVGGVVDF